MTYEQQGIYRGALDHQWVEGSIPADPNQLASLFPKISAEKFAAIWPLISTKFRLVADGRLVNDRLELQRRLRDAYIKTQKRNARKRRPARSSAANHGSAMAQPSHQSSSSSSSSTVKPISPSARATNTSPIFGGTPTHKTHACCGVVCLHQSQFEGFLQRLAAQPDVDPQKYVRNFFDEWNTRYETGDRSGVIPGQDMFDFWRDRWAETHPEIKNTSAKPSRHAKWLGQNTGAEVADV